MRVQGKLSWSLPRKEVMQLWTLLSDSYVLTKEPKDLSVENALRSFISDCLNGDMNGPEWFCSGTRAASAVLRNTGLVVAVQRPRGDHFVRDRATSSDPCMDTAIVLTREDMDAHVGRFLAPVVKSQTVAALKIPCSPRGLMSPGRRSSRLRGSRRPPGCVKWWCGTGERRCQRGRKWAAAANTELTATLRCVALCPASSGVAL